jgi:alkanesulfonate monooxygenase SsuD/methylene tetrahydromethanopterin reductase-like flavin-dependent oxidoreductase (luciferase family)
MVNCAPTSAASYERSATSFTWYTKRSVELITSVARWLEEMKNPLGTYDYLREPKRLLDQGMVDLVNFDYLKDTNAVIVGDPEEVVRRCKEYEAAGVDLLLCLINPHAISHAHCMETIELMGAHVLPAFSG